MTSEYNEMLDFCNTEQIHYSEAASALHILTDCTGFVFYWDQSIKQQPSNWPDKAVNAQKAEQEFMKHFKMYSDGWTRYWRFITQIKTLTAQWQNLLLKCLPVSLEGNWSRVERIKTTFNNKFSPNSQGLSTEGLHIL